VARCQSIWGAHNLCLTAHHAPWLRSAGDPWLEAVNIRWASFALSFNLVPPAIATVDDEATRITLADVLDPNGFCVGIHELDEAGRIDTWRRTSRLRRGDPRRSAARPHATERA
jgi:hypothetical protein